MQNSTTRVVGPKLAELEKVAAAAKSFQTSIVVLFEPSKRVPIDAPQQFLMVFEYASTPRFEKPDSMQELSNLNSGYWYRGKFSEGMLQVAEMCGAGQPFNKRGTLIYESIEVTCKGASKSSTDLKILALEAWCEAFGLEPPDFKKMKDEVSKGEAQRLEVGKQLLELLKSGSEGVQEWNKSSHHKKKLCDFKKSDLQGKDLTALKLDENDFKSSNFDQANLTKAFIVNSNIRSCTFRGATMHGAKLKSPNFANCDFTGADLDKATIEGSYSGCIFDNAKFTGGHIEGSALSKASFVNTDFSSARFCGCDLKGVDLSTTTLNKAEFYSCSYDAETKWPPGFAKPEGVTFRGSGADPFKVEALKKSAISGAIDFDTLIQQLNKQFDQSRFKKSMKMLQSEKFQLFSEVADDSVVGVVKSQTDADLVYSCRLTGGGEFFCCTQNLNVCGGLRGSLCKHLLVLLIGLAKANELDPTKTYQWVMQSLAIKPELNREIATEVFLRYQAAEAGELDWRPTETMPEDYYAY